MVAGAILPDAARYLDVSQVEKGRVRPQQIPGQRQANLGPACPAMWLNVHVHGSKFLLDMAQLPPFLVVVVVCGWRYAAMPRQSTRPGMRKPPPLQSLRDHRPTRQSGRYWWRGAADGKLKLCRSLAILTDLSVT